MIVTFPGTNKNVVNAVTRCNQILQDPAFFDLIRQHPAFDRSTATPAQIADLMQRSTSAVTVELYTPKWLWSKALAYEDHRYPNKVFLNARRLSRSLGSLSATIIHECVHALDAEDEALRFGHGDNNPNGKENTAPYWIGDLAYVMISGKTAELAQLFADMDSEWA